jgi:hypothetical protein
MLIARNPKLLDIVKMAFLRKVLLLRERKWQEAEDCIIRSFVTCMLQ